MTRAQLYGALDRAAWWRRTNLQGGHQFRAYWLHRALEIRRALRGGR